MIDLFPEFHYHKWDIHFTATDMICSWRHPGCELTLCKVEWPKGIQATLHLIVVNEIPPNSRGNAASPTVLGINQGFGEIMEMVKNVVTGQDLGEKILELNPKLRQLIFTSSPSTESLFIAQVIA